MAEKEYIERNAVLEIVKRTSGDYAAAFSEIRQLPAADVAEVVRCKDCTAWGRNTGIADSPNGWCFYHDECMNQNDFCRYGERKESTP